MFDEFLCVAKPSINSNNHTGEMGKSLNGLNQSPVLLAIFLLFKSILSLLLVANLHSWLHRSTKDFARQPDERGIKIGDCWRQSSSHILSNH